MPSTHFVMDSGPGPRQNITIKLQTHEKQGAEIKALVVGVLAVVAVENCWVGCMYFSVKMSARVIIKCPF